MTSALHLPLVHTQDWWLLVHYESLDWMAFHSHSTVTSLYVKSGGTGKSSKNGSVESATTIGAVSRIGVNLYEHALGRRFRKMTTTFRMTQFDFLLLFNFLALLLHQPLHNLDTVALEAITLEAPDVTLFKELQAVHPTLILAVKYFVRAERRKSRVGRR